MTEEEDLALSDVLNDRFYTGAVISIWIEWTDFLWKVTILKDYERSISRCSQRHFFGGEKKKHSLFFPEELTYRDKWMVLMK